MNKLLLLLFGLLSTTAWAQPGMTYTSLPDPSCKLVKIQNQWIIQDDKGFFMGYYRPAPPPSKYVAPAKKVSARFIPSSQLVDDSGGYGFGQWGSYGYSNYGYGYNGYNNYSYGYNPSPCQTYQAPCPTRPACHPARPVPVAQPALIQVPLPAPVAPVAPLRDRLPMVGL